MSYEVVYLWMMVFLRAGGMLSLLPVFSGQNIPIAVRVALAGLIALVTAGVVPVPEALPSHVILLVLASAKELLTGLMMGFAVRLVFYAIEFAGQLMSTEIGLVVSAQMDPISRTSSTPIGVALFWFSSLIFLISGCHHFVLAAFVRSFDLAGPGDLTIHRNVADLFIRSTGNIFLVAVQMSAPLIAMNFVVTLTFAILGKAAPSINVFTESFSVRILGGLTLLGLTLGLTAQIVLSNLRQAPELMLRLIP